MGYNYSWISCAGIVGNQPSAYWSITKGEIMTQYTTARTGYDNAPDDSDNDFLCATQLQRIAGALEEILRLVKLDQEKFQKLNEEK